ncbi:MAG: hypothetical protein ACE5JB_03020 [bacterium]
MLSKNILCVILLSIFAVLLIGCSRATNEEPSNFSAIALQGKKVFETKNCGECHSVGEPREDNKAPNLSSPIIANDSMFVQAHLKFVEKSKMPPIQLTEKEILLVSNYIAELHRVNYQSIPEEEADTHCPVCYAPVSKEKAKNENLYFSYLGEKYYFECQDCTEIFEKAPGAFLVLWKNYEEEKKKDKVKANIE